MGKFTELSKTLFNFFGRLGYDVYLEGNVPEKKYNPVTGVDEKVKPPYLTVSYESNSVVGESLLLQGRIWTKSTKREEVNQISDKLYNMIGEGVKLPISQESGFIAFYRGSPFIQPIADEDPTLQVNYFNLEMQIF